MLLFLGNCQKCKKEVCPTPTSAKFKMYQPLDYSEYNEATKTYTPKEYIVDEDVFFMESTITFEAEDSMATSYEWKIGDDDRVFTTKKFSLRFKEDDLGAVRQLDIRLIIKKTPAFCNAGDNGIDTLVRKVDFINGRTEPEKWAMYGKYLGYNEDEPDKKYIVEIKYDVLPYGFRPVNEKEYYLINLVENCISNNLPFYARIGYGNNSAFTFNQADIPPAPGGMVYCTFGDYGFAYLSPIDGRINIKYLLYSPLITTTPKYRKFIGTKIL